MTVPLFSKLKFGRNTIKALCSNLMGLGQTVFWLHLFGYPLEVTYALVGACITVPLANIVLFRGIDVLLVWRSRRIVMKELRRKEKEAQNATQ